MIIVSLTEFLLHSNSGVATFNRKLVVGDEVWVEHGVGPYSVFSGTLNHADL